MHVDMSWTCCACDGVGGLLPGYSHLQHHVPRAREPVAPRVDQPARDALELWPDRPLLEAVQGDEGDRLARGTDPPLGMRWAAGVGGGGAPAAPAPPPASLWGTLRPPPLSLCARRVPVPGWPPPTRGRRYLGFISLYLGCISLDLGCISISATASDERASKHDSSVSRESDCPTHGSRTLDATSLIRSLISSAPSEATPAEATPSEATPSEATPSEATPAEATPAEATPEEAAPAEARPGGTGEAASGPTAGVPAPPARDALARWLGGGRCAYCTAGCPGGGCAPAEGRGRGFGCWVGRVRACRGRGEGIRVLGR